jgi:hypothetical protein
LSLHALDVMGRCSAAGRLPSCGLRSRWDDCRLAIQVSVSGCSWLIFYMAPASGPDSNGADDRLPALIHMNMFNTHEL